MACIATPRTAVPNQGPAPKGTVNYTRVDGFDDRTEVRLRLTAQLPYQITETLDPVVAANLSILKSPTVQRQVDGRLWCWEGCHDDSGCCHGLPCSAVRWP